MFQRFVALLLLLWILGFAWFAVDLPQPVDAVKTDGVVVLTGAEGRIARGVEVLEKGWARRMLVSGVDREVRPREFQAEYSVSARLMKCCVTLGYESVDTRSNAREAARWVASTGAGSIRLVTTDWHMRRSVHELRRLIPASVVVVEDAVPSRPRLRDLFLEYNKLLARWLAQAWGD